MILSTTDARVVRRALAEWERDGTLTAAESTRLAGSFRTAGFNWQRLARYSFRFAIACIVIAVGAVLTDSLLLTWIGRIFTAPAAVRAAGFAALAAGLFAFGARRRARMPEKRYSTEAVFFLGVCATAAAVVFLGQAVDTGSGRRSLLVLLAAGVYAAIAFWIPSTLVWVFALLSLGGWMGAETGYASGWGAYWLGMNYPLRFLLFGALLTGWSVGMGHWRRGRIFQHPTLVMGLLYGFVSLWLMSIFGNYGDVDAWTDVPQYQMLHWSLLFGAAALAAIWVGLRFEHRTALGFGLTFFWINLYTRYFEFFWDGLHKAVFFAVLGLSFWWLGSRAESLWSARDASSWRRLFGAG
jgi:hypothetical protein